MNLPATSRAVLARYLCRFLRCGTHAQGTQRKISTATPGFLTFHGRRLVILVQPQLAIHIQVNYGPLFVQILVRLFPLRQIASNASDRQPLAAACIDTAWGLPELLTPTLAATLDHHGVASQRLAVPD